VNGAAEGSLRPFGLPSLRLPPTISPACSGAVGFVGRYAASASGRMGERSGERESALYIAWLHRRLRYRAALAAERKAADNRLYLQATAPRSRG
jgi:hypothetical protein